MQVCADMRSENLTSFPNPDRDFGDRLRMNDIRQLVKDDPDLQNLSKAEEEEL
jgi:hypothetical protein